LGSDRKGVASAAVEILLITPEIAPYSRSGELGDVCAALPKALRSLGHKVTVISPLWAGIDPTARGLARRLSNVEVDLGTQRYACTLHDGRTTGGVELVFVGHAEAFAGGPATGNAEAQARAALVLSLAAAQVAAARQPAPEVVHAHAWFAAGALALLKDELPAAARVLSLHDVRQQGSLRDLPAGTVVPPALLDLAGASGTGTASLLAAGIAAAAHVVANSQEEAERLRASDTPIAHTLRADNKLIGVANGLDAARWNPLTDPLLPSRFDPVDLGGKARCKDALSLELGLPIRPEVPLIACVGSSAQDGGAALVPQIAGRLLSNDVQLVVMSDDAAEREPLEQLLQRFADRLRVVAIEDRLQHRLIAAADLVIVAAHDPRHGDLHLCGQRYGALPIVRKIAAMADAVVDADAELLTGNGFVFDGATAEDLLGATQRALAAFSRRAAFDALRRRVMKLDVSWERSARRYEYIYREVRNAAAKA
jgi:starch synthase